MPKAHPICVMKKVVDQGLSKEEAERACIREGKVHGISRLAEEYRRITGGGRRY